MDAKLLRIYLNDHLATAVAGRELAGRARRSNQGSDFGPFLGRVQAELDDHRAQLEAVMERLGVRKDPVKPAAGWLFEKVGRLKLNGRVRGYSPLSRVLELEGLAIVSQGHASLWTTLAAVVGEDARVGDVDLGALAARAEELHAELGDARLRAARAALA